MFNFSMAIAIFSMFFGAGNVVFPLLLGVQTESQFGWAFFGLLFTGIGGPLLGLLGGTLFQGKCLPFFTRFSKPLGLVLLTTTFGLLGPFAVLPRCTTVAHAALPYLPLWLFSLIFCAIALLCCWKKKLLLPALGYFLSPLLIGCLLLIIYQGFKAPTPASSTLTSWQAYRQGLSTGYDTMDLIASIYFSAGIWAMVAMRNSKHVFKTTLRSGLLGCLLLALIYLGLCQAAARFAPQLQNVPPEQLMMHLTYLALGPHLAIIANIAIALACLTTVISLTMTLSEILSKEIAPSRLSYRQAATANLVITTLLANVGFAAIMHLIHPLATICYPVIIALTCFNIFYKLRRETTS